MVPRFQSLENDDRRDDQDDDTPDTGCFKVARSRGLSRSHNLSEVPRWPRAGGLPRAGGRASLSDILSSLVFYVATKTTFNLSQHPCIISSV